MRNTDRQAQNQTAPPSIPSHIGAEFEQGCFWQIVHGWPWLDLSGCLLPGSWLASVGSGRLLLAGRWPTCF